MATPEDAGAIVDIYLPYVRDTAVSFETVAPSVQEMRSRMTTTLATLPWLVVADSRGPRDTPTQAHTGHGTPTVAASMFRCTSTHPFRAGDMAAEFTRRC